MKKILTLVIAILSISQIDAQNQKNSNSEREAYDGMSVKAKERDKGETIGTPYINEKFLPAQIDTDNQVTVRYNAYQDEIEYTKNGQQYILFPIVNKTEVTLLSPKKKYVYLDYKKGKEFKTGYLVELANLSNYKLYKKETIKFTPGVAPKTSYDRQTPDQYRQAKDEFYLQTNDGEILDLPTNRRNFAKFFGKNEKVIASYIKENNIDLSNEASMIRFVQYLNSNFQ